MVLFSASCLVFTSLLRSDEPVLFTNWRRPLCLVGVSELERKSGLELEKLGLDRRLGSKRPTISTRSESLPKVLMTLMVGLLMGLGSSGDVVKAFEDLSGAGSFLSIFRTLSLMTQLRATAKIVTVFNII